MNYLTKWNDGKELVVQAVDLRMAEKFAQSFYGHRGARLISINERPDLPVACDAELLGRKERT
jgi:hypothetical protein